MASVASAQGAIPTFNFTGEWYQNRGPLVDIPANGGPVFCTPGQDIADGCPGQNQAIPAPLRPLNGGVKGSGTIMAKGYNPVTFTVAPSAFAQAAGQQTVAVAFVPTVVQLGSAFVLTGPAATRMTTAPDGQTRILKKDKWMTTARASKNFGWCPGVGGPGCVAPGSAAAPYNGLVKYTGGTNAYGGTMAMLLSGAFTVSVTVGSTPGPTMNKLLINGPGGAMSPQSQHPGRAYAAFDTDAVLGAPIHVGFMTGPPCTNVLPPLPVGCGIITTSGPTTGGGPVGTDTNYNWGFPWTTGTVSARNTGTNMGNAATTTLTAMGTDMRSPFGKGRMTLVAGGTTTRLAAAQHFAGLDIVTIRTQAPGAAPGLSPVGLGAAASLMMLAGGYLVHRRRASGA